MANLITQNFIHQQFEMSINSQLAFRALDSIIGEDSANKFILSISEDISEYINRESRNIDYFMAAFRDLNSGELSFSDFLVVAFVWKDSERGFNYYQLINSILKLNNL